MAEVLIPMPDGRTLALELADYQRALQRGRELTPPESSVTQSDEVTDAAGMEAKTGVPASWWAEAARRGDVPHLRAGKYVRFRVEAALKAMEAKR